MLLVEDAWLDYGGVSALMGVGLQVAPGRITAVVGSNGAGKTSLMKAISGLEKLSTGSISFDGEALTGMQPSEIVRRGVALVPEGRELFPRMTVEENLLVGATVIRNADQRRGSLSQVQELFPVLARKRHALASTLSGGEQQMLAFARALMSSPRMLLLDEPSIGLAPQIEEQLMASVRHIAAEMGVGVLLVEQNAMLALEASERAYVIELGKVVMEGASEQLLKDPKVQSYYLGR
jgi:branched-chain amino acid transport system ATP-binding protein